MHEKANQFDICIVGGGLAGLVAAARLNDKNLKVALIDAPVPGTPELLGGFASFSGAKFSLYPAGSALANVVGGHDALRRKYSEVIRFFAKSGIQKFQIDMDGLIGHQSSVSADLSYRNYHSIVLSPLEVQKLVDWLEGNLKNITVVRRKVMSIEVLDDSHFGIVNEDHPTIFSNKVIVAAGRLGSQLLSDAGVPEVDGKGVDFGVRLEFENCHPLAALRSKGADAKILGSEVRTFCLNSPGRIFHYEALGMLIPGGIVAGAGYENSNVGFLRRIAQKSEAINQFRERAASFRPDGTPLSFIGHDASFAMSPLITSLLPSGTGEAIYEFVEQLIRDGLITLPDRFKVHYPLVDWHWPIYAQSGTLKTKVEGLYAVGDASGHARGLLQAATMGWLSAEEAWH